jgi:hypothetical protein
MIDKGISFNILSFFFNVVKEAFVDDDKFIFFDKSEIILFNNIDLIVVIK